MKHLWDVRYQGNDHSNARDRREAAVQKYTRQRQRSTTSQSNCNLIASGSNNRDHHIVISAGGTNSVSSSTTSSGSDRRSTTTSQVPVRRRPARKASLATIFSKSNSSPSKPQPSMRRVASEILQDTSMKRHGRRGQSSRPPSTCRGFVCLSETNIF